MKKAVAATSLLALALVTGCATPLTSEGSRVRTITAGQQERTCEFLGTATGEGYPATGGMAQALTKARNAVGKAGGNGMKIILQENQPVGNGYWSYVTVEAYSCAFN